MSHALGRRSFLGAAGALAGTALLGQAQSAPPEVRVGVIGTGGRGSYHVNLLTQLGVKVPAVCDIDPAAAQRARDIVVKAGQPAPEMYTRDEFVYRELLARDDLDGVIIATWWQCHAPMAVDAMKAGKITGIEVPAALSLEECWALVNTHEETKTPCMMLENWSFRRDNLALLNMVRKGLFGDITHCRCSYSHDCMHYFTNPDGSLRWSGEFLVNHNRLQYPTHGEGPVLSWMNINCGDAFATLTATATDSRAIHAFFVREFGPDHPNAKRAFAQGDVVTAVIRTQNGNSIVLDCDLQQPRPYDNRWVLQGLNGIYNEQRASLFLEGRSPKSHEWEPFEPYQKEFEHPWWAEHGASAESAGHGGADYMEIALFIKAIRERAPLPLDIYDSATMSSVIALSEQSIAQGGAPVECPDFTKGAWKTRAPFFAVV